jgi:hypothetical protein
MPHPAHVKLANRNLLALVLVLLALRPFATPANASEDDAGVTQYQLAPEPLAQVADFTPCPAVDATWGRRFIADFNAVSPGWQRTSASATHEVVDGAYRLLIDAPNTTARGRAGQYFEGDLQVSVDADQLSGSGRASYGLLLHVQSTNSFYRFEVSGDGSFAIWKSVDGQLELLLAGPPSAAINAGLASNHLSVISQGHMKQFCANSYLLATITDPAYTLGDVGVTASSGAVGGIQVAFDNLEVRGPAPGTSTPAGATSTAAASSQAVHATPSPSTGPGLYPASWGPPAGKASLVVVNAANAEVTFTMADQEHRLKAHNEEVAVFEPGRHTFTASDPRFESYNSECDLEADAIYYWYTDDAVVSQTCRKLWP